MLAYGQDADQEPVEDIVEDIAEGEDEGDASVETDEPTRTDPPPTGVSEGEKPEEEEDEEEKALRPSPDADTHIHFVKPTHTDFTAGILVKFLVGFTNKGSKDFFVESMDASFRYPQDYNFYIQNFTAARFNRVVEPSRQATFEYSFTPSETFNARPFGLTINLNYKDVDGAVFQEAVFNDTINIIEADEGLDGETFFLVLFLVAIAVLILVGVHQLLGNFGSKRLLKPKQPVEMGTQSKSGVDYDWLPEGTLNTSPRSSPRQSPGRRRSKRNPGNDD